jgi:hypothetical protein
MERGETEGKRSLGRLHVDGTKILKQSLQKENWGGSVCGLHLFGLG